MSRTKKRKNLTYRDLLKILVTLKDEQLDKDILVSEGCDDNGNADFYTIYDLTKVGVGVIDSAADLLFKKEHPVLLYEV